MNCVDVLARVKSWEFGGRISGLVREKYGGPVGEGNGGPPADHLWRETVRRQLETAVAGIAKRL